MSATSWRPAAERLVGGLRAVFGERLRSVVAYGPHVEGHVDGPLSCLALVTAITAADLEACAQLSHAWQRERIATSPGLFLDAERAARGKRPDGLVGALVHDLESARSALVRAGDGAVRAWDVEPGALSSPLVARALTRCTDAHDALLKSVEEPHAG